MTIRFISIKHIEDVAPEDIRATLPWPIYNWWVSVYAQAMQSKYDAILSAAGQILVQAVTQHADARVAQICVLESLPPETATTAERICSVRTLDEFGSVDAAVAVFYDATRNAYSVLFSWHCHREQSVLELTLHKA